MSKNKSIGFLLFATALFIYFSLPAKAKNEDAYICLAKAEDDAQQDIDKLVEKVAGLIESKDPGRLALKDKMERDSDDLNHSLSHDLRFDIDLTSVQIGPGSTLHKIKTWFSGLLGHDKLCDKFAALYNGLKSYIKKSGGSELINEKDPNNIGKFNIMEILYAISDKFIPTLPAEFKDELGVVEPWVIDEAKQKEKRTYSFIFLPEAGDKLIVSVEAKQFYIDKNDKKSFWPRKKLYKVKTQTIFSLKTGEVTYLSDFSFGEGKEIKIKQQIESAVPPWQR